MKAIEIWRHASNRLVERSVFAFICCCFVSAILDLNTVGAAESAFLLSSDTQGQLRPCESCPDGVGDISRRALVIAKSRQNNSSLVLVDVGNALIGPDSFASGGKALVTSYNAMGYDVLNVSHRDFRLGEAQTLTALADSKFAVLSANLLNNTSGQLLFKPYVVKASGGQRVGIVGVTEVPASIANLPHIKQQMAGVKVRPPLEALGEWLPKAKKESDLVVLLYYGTAGGLKEVRDKFGVELAVILVGGLRPEELPTGGKPPLVGAGEHGQTMALAKLKNGNADVKQIPIDASVPPDPEMQKLVAPYLKSPLDGLLAAASTNAPPPRSSQSASALPAPPQTGQPQRVRASAKNNAAEVKITELSLVEQIGNVSASLGEKLLVLKTEWENIIPLKVIRQRPTPTKYQIPKLSDHLYVVVNGQNLARIHAKAGQINSHLPATLTLEELGSKLAGEVVFDLPVAAVESLELRFYDFAFGNFTVPLVAPAKPAEPARALAPLQKNPVVEAGVFGLKRIKEHAGRKAAEGKTLAVVDLRARSMITMDAAASAYDSSAKPGARTRVGTVADWKESRKYAHLVADGEYGYPALDQSSLAPEPRFLPDLMTGGQLVFEVPEKVQSLELRCDFPNTNAEDEQAKKPAGLTFALEGTRPRVPQRPAILSMDDEMFKVAVTAQSTAAEFAGQKAAADRQFLVLDVTVANSAKGGDFFQTKAQLKYATETGESVAMDQASARSEHPGTDIVWVPGGERRSFQVVYQVPQKDRRPRLLFTGATSAQTLNLTPLAAAVATAPPRTAETGRTDAAQTEPERRAEPVQPAPEARTPPVPSPQPVPSPAPKPQQVAEAVKNPPPAANEPGPTSKPAAITTRVPKGLAGVGLTPEQVNAAIDKGADALWGLVKKDINIRNNTILLKGEDLLACLALVHANAHQRMPDFNATLRRSLADLPVRYHSYEDGLVCMLVDSYADPAFLPKLSQSARYLLEAQGSEGTWTYKSVTKGLEAALTQPQPRGRALIVTGGISLDEPSSGEPLVRRLPPDKGNDGDNSCSQYALLGLHSASRAGLKAPPDTWKAALAVHRARQCDDGGFAYELKQRSYGSMTCAGICALALCRHELGETNAADDPGIKRALAWLDKNFSVKENPVEGDWLYYYLYSLERVGRILETEFIGDHEWYPLGARQLVDAQQPDGTWKGRTGRERDPQLATSFALLFLTRATPTLHQELKRGGRGKLQTAFTLPVSRLYVILDGSGSMLDERDGQQKFAIACNAVTEAVKELPDGSEVALRVYGHRKRAIDPGADEDTQLLIPMGKMDREKFLMTLKGLRARGKTPLTRSITEAAKDLQAIAADKPVTAVLLTDGGEDTQARPDPVRAARELGKLPNVRFCVVGFDVAGREDWGRQLRGIAEQGHGVYIPAAESQALRREMRSAILGEPEQFVVVDKANTQAGSGRFGQGLELPEGRYTLRTTFAGQEFAQQFWVNTERTTSVIFDASQVAAAPASAGGATPVPATAPAPPTPPPAAPAATPAVQPTPAAATPAVSPEQKPAKKFCTSCGAPLQVGAKFCSGCGVKLD
jgi:hypothetical protein